MPLQLFRLAGNKALPVTTSQRGRQYFHTMSATVVIASNSVKSFLAGVWFTSAGDAAGAFVTGSGSQALCVNGVLQQPGLYSVVSTAVRITAPNTVGGLTLHQNYPVTLQTYNASSIVSTTRTFAIR